MYDFMEYCLRRYYKITSWNDDNQYANLIASSRAILDFSVPRGLSLTMSRLPTPFFKTSYSIHAIPSLNGSIAYLYSSRNLDVRSSARVQFKDMVDRFRIVHPPSPVLPALTNISPHNHPEEDAYLVPGRSGDYLLFGRMFVPAAHLEALYSRRLSPTAQLVVTGLSAPRKTGGSSHVTTQLQYDTGKYCAEVSFTTEDALFGLRALYNFNGSEPTALPPPPPPPPYPQSPARATAAQISFPTTPPDLDPETTKARWSAGAELYYAVRDKSAGVSGGLRYRKLSNPVSPIYTPPITATFTFNPIVGHMSAAYATQVSDEVALCSRFDFNVWSYESDLVVGLEWRSRDEGLKSAEAGELGLIGKIRGVEKWEDEIVKDAEAAGEVRENRSKESVADERLEGLVKARYGISKGLALMWEGRYKNTLFSLGLVADLNNRSNPVRSVGLEVQYFS